MAVQPSLVDPAFQNQDFTADLALLINVADPEPQTPFQYEWKVGGNSFFIVGQYQKGSLCGLHALNATIGLEDWTKDSNFPANKNSWPWYNVAMLKKAKEIASTNKWADYPGDPVDESDPMSLLLLARSAPRPTADIYFPIRIDVDNHRGNQYNFGLYPLPKDGRWVVSIRGHHFAVFRKNDNFLIVDSIAAFHGPNPHVKEIVGEKEYIRFMEDYPSHAYIIFYTKEMLDETYEDGKYYLVLERDAEAWYDKTENKVRNLHVPWGDFFGEKFANPKKYDSEKYIAEYGTYDLSSEFIGDFLPLGNTSNASGTRWSQAEYELRGLSKLNIQVDETLTKKRDALYSQLQALELSNGPKDQAFNEVIRRNFVEGRFSIKASDVVKYSELDQTVRRNRRADWTSLMFYLLKHYRNKIISNYVKYVGVMEGLKDWKSNLKRNLDPIFIDHVLEWARVDWDTIALNRQYVDEVVDILLSKLIKKGTLKSKEKPILDVLARWAPIGYDNPKLQQLIGSNIGLAETKLSTFLSGVKKVVSFPGVITNVTIKEVRNFDATVQVDGVIQNRLDLIDYLTKNYPNVVMKEQNIGVIHLYFPFREDSDYELSNDKLPWSPGEIKDYLETALLLEINRRWNPLEFHTNKTNLLKNAPTDNVDPNEREIFFKFFTLNFIREALFIPDITKLNKEKETEITVLNATVTENGRRKAYDEWLAWFSTQKPWQIYFYVGYPAVFPIYYENLEAMSELQKKLESFRQNGNYKTRYDDLDVILQKSMGRVSLNLAGMTYDNPLTSDISIDPDRLDFTISVVSAMAASIYLKDTLKANLDLVPAVFEKVWIESQGLAQKLGIGNLIDLWKAMLRAYRRTKLPLTEGSFSAKAIQKILILEQIEDVENEIRKVTAPEEVSITEERLVRSERLISGSVKARVYVKTRKDPDGPFHSDRYFYYRWRFEHYPTNASKRVREWYVGPTKEMECTVDIPFAYGDGILYAETYVLRKQGSDELKFVATATCPNTLTIRLLQECSRCRQIFPKSENTHGKCIFHPIPNITQTYLSMQAERTPFERGWNDFYKKLNTYWNVLNPVTSNEWIQYIQKFLGEAIRNKDDFFQVLEDLPVLTMVTLLQHFPWSKAVNDYFVNATEERLPARIREMEASIPVFYLQTVQDKIIQFLGSKEYLRRFDLPVAPSKSFLDGFAPPRIWQDDQTSGLIKSLIGTMPYGYDEKNGLWRCCGKQGFESKGCWTDFHSATYPYIRFLGHAEHHDFRGSWPIHRLGEFKAMWESLQDAIEEKPFNWQKTEKLIAHYFNLQSYLSGYEPGQTVYWPMVNPKKIAKRSDRDTFAIVTNPNIPKEGFAPFSRYNDLLKAVETANTNSLSLPPKVPYGPAPVPLVLPPIVPPPPVPLPAPAPGPVVGPPGGPGPIVGPPGGPGPVGGPPVPIPIPAPVFVPTVINIPPPRAPPKKLIVTTNIKVNVTPFAYRKIPTKDSGYAEANLSILPIRSLATYPLRRPESLEILPINTYAIQALSRAAGYWNEK